MRVALKVHIQNIFPITDSGCNEQAVSICGPKKRLKVSPSLHPELPLRFPTQRKYVDGANRGLSNGKASTIRRHIQEPVLFIRNQGETKKFAASSGGWVNSGYNQFFLIVCWLADY